jgi:GGDEF domain-containing protein
VALTQRRGSQGATAEDSFLPAVRTLFQGIAEFVAKDDAGRRPPGRPDTAELYLRDEDDYSVPEIESKAGTAIHILREFGTRTIRHYHGRNSEQRAVIGMLMDLLQDLTIAGPDAMRKLKEVRTQMEAATDPEGLRNAKLELSKCLDQVRQEAAQQIGLAGDTADRDSATKLPGRAHAEAAIADACRQTEPNCAAVLLIDRLSLYNRRYGREVGDVVLRYYTTLLQKIFAPRDLFRWTGPALVMLRQGTQEKVQAELRRSLDSRAKFEIEIGARSILLPLDACWSVFPATADPRMMINKIEAFISC